MNVEAFLAAASPTAFFTSALLGLLIGAFYGYQLVHYDVPLKYPVALWAVGVMFVGVMAVLAVLGPEPPPHPVEFGMARSLLWTVTCGSIPIGRFLRHLGDVALLRHKRRKVENGNGITKNG